MQIEFIEIPLIDIGSPNSFRTGKSFNKSDFQDSGIPIIKIGNMKEQGINISECSYISEAIKSDNLTNSGDVLIAMRGATSGKLSLVDEKSNNLFYVGSIGNFGKLNTELIHPSFIKYIEKQIIKILETEMVGGAIPMVSKKMLESFKVRVPASKENQLSLAKQLDKAEILSQEVLKNIANRIELVKKLRQAILQEAVQGKLVPQDPNDEPASELLKRIKAEKEQLLVDKEIKKEKPLPAITDDEIPYKLPKEWEWCRLGEISNRIHYGYNASANFENMDYKLLRITDIQRGRVNWDKVPGCEISDNDYKKFALEKNNILIARTGGTIGKSFLVNQLSGKPVFASYLIRVIPNNFMNAEFIELFLNSNLYWEQLIAKSQGTGQPNVNATSLKGLYLPLPSLSEQKRILAKADELMGLCDRLEEQIGESKDNADMLMQAVLKEAFQA
jgi:restriction endonuclease S subunit